MSLYYVCATTTDTIPATDGEDWTRTRGVPTFALDSDRQGIVSAEHAARIAADVLAAPGRSVSLSIFTADGSYLHAETFTPGQVTA